MLDVRDVVNRTPRHLTSRRELHPSSFPSLPIAFRSAPRQPVRLDSTTRYLPSTGVMSLTSGSDLRQRLTDERTHRVSLHKLFARSAINIGRAMTRVDHCANGCFDLFGFLLEAGGVPEEQCCRGDCSQRISHALASDVRRGAMHRLIQSN